MAAHTLADGSIFAGRYRVDRAIASGSMGAVYEVTHLETEAKRALILLLKLSYREQLAVRILEAKRPAISGRTGKENRQP